MKPILVEGSSIAKVWENALIELYNSHETIPTQYDLNPLTGEQNPPSIDAPVIMFVEHAMNEPKLHCCLEGGPAEIAEYTLEVVHGIKDHWVKQTPNDTQWLYTYHSRLANWGGQCNSASIIEDAPIDPQNPWTQLSFCRKINGDIKYQIIDPVDQIQDMINQISETPYTRRAIAITGVPCLDKGQSDPPCLRTITCRGFYRNNCLEIDMKVHFRSRDAWGAALFNMNALVQLQKYITDQIQNNFMIKAKELLKSDKTYECPVCKSDIQMRDTSKNLDEDIYKNIICQNCNLKPFIVKVGSYTDVSDSFHVYGHKLKEFQNRFINSALKQPEERRFWDLSTPIMQELIKEGEEKAYKIVKELDIKNNKENFPKINQNMK